LAVLYLPLLFLRGGQLLWGIKTCAVAFGRMGELLVEKFSPPRWLYAKNGGRLGWRGLIGLHGARLGQWIVGLIAAIHFCQYCRKRPGGPRVFGPPGVGAGTYRRVTPIRPGLGSDVSFGADGGFRSVSDPGGDSSVVPDYVLLSQCFFSRRLLCCAGSAGRSFCYGRRCQVGSSGRPAAGGSFRCGGCCLRRSVRSLIRCSLGWRNSL